MFHKRALQHGFAGNTGARHAGTYVVKRGTTMEAMPAVAMSWNDMQRRFDTFAPFLLKASLAPRKKTALSTLAMHGNLQIRLSTINICGIDYIIALYGRVV